MNDLRKKLTKTLKLGNSIISIGSTFGDFDPYLPLTEQFEIKVVVGNKVVNIRIPLGAENVKIFAQELKNVAQAFNEVAEGLSSLMEEERKE